MSGPGYRLKLDEGSRPGVRRAAVGRADKAVAHLRDESNDDLATAVHGARKDLKKLRSLIRLVRGGLGETVYERENDRYRSAARMLGDARDAEAKLECVAQLRDRYRDRFPTRWSRDFMDGLEAERDRIAKGGVPPKIAEAIDAIESGRAAAQHWHLTERRFELFRPGLKRAYDRGRSQFSVVLDDPSDDAVHDWRKRVKDLWYQLSFLELSWPAVIEATSEEAHELSSILGDHHDLAVLRKDVEANPGQFGGEAQISVLELVARRQEELIEAAIPIGRRLYAEKPKRFVRRVSSYWSTTRG